MVGKSTGQIERMTGLIMGMIRQHYSPTCSSSNPCGEWSGDCDNDIECEGNLKSYQRVGTSALDPISGCSGSGKSVGGNIVTVQPWLDWCKWWFINPSGPAQPGLLRTAAFVTAQNITEDESSSTLTLALSKPNVLNSTPHGGKGGSTGPVDKWHGLF